MRFETKYGIGDDVVSIHRTQVQLPPEKCSACDGTGKCDLKGQVFHCPKCAGKTTTQATGWGWVIVNYGTVRSVEVRTRAPDDSDPTDRDDWDQRPEEVRYMFGVGGGSVYEEHQLWPNREAAQAECDRRNDYDRAKVAAA